MVTVSAVPPEKPVSAAQTILCGSVYAGPPLLTRIGLNAGGGLTVRDALLLPLNVPEIVAVLVTVTALVVMVKVAEVAPAATVTFVGTDAIEVLLLDRLTTAPPAGAGPLRVTVPVEEAPPVTLAGFTANDEIEFAVAVKVATMALPALMVTDALGGEKV